MDEEKKVRVSLSNYMKIINLFFTLHIDVKIISGKKIDNIMKGDNLFSDY